MKKLQRHFQEPRAAAAIIHFELGGGGNHTSQTAGRGFELSCAHHTRHRRLAGLPSRRAAGRGVGTRAREAAGAERSVWMGCANSPRRRACPRAWDLASEPVCPRRARPVAPGRRHCPARLRCHRARRPSTRSEVRPAENGSSQPSAPPRPAQTSLALGRKLTIAHYTQFAFVTPNGNLIVCGWLCYFNVHYLI